ncbi:MAG: hypothetical protein NZ602_01565 [Thermoguttaceae bacterium]|nr:hypothetical protein [Thermoguttaceae bacterium]MDW8036818.1 hypothetical protein [Thermoguttaceae bacterium]
MIRFRWEKLLLWVVLTTVVAMAVGQLAAWVGGYLRPVVVFALLVGCLLGGMLVVGIRLLDLAHRSSILVGLVLAGVICTGSEHWGAYRQAKREYERTLADWQAKTQGLVALSHQFAQALQQQLPRPPSSFAEYLASQLERGRPIGPWLLKGNWVWISWVLEAALVLLAAGGVVWPTLRWPYCSSCESWYRTIRQGRLLPADLAQWAELFQIPVFHPESARRFRAQFRLLQCLGQCSAGRLQLVWENPHGQLQRWEVKLDTLQREKLNTIWEEASDQAHSSDSTSASACFPNRSS